MKNNKSIRFCVLLIIVLTLVTTIIGIFYTTNSKPYLYTNIYGNNIKIYGDGLYNYDSYFKAPIFKGTDCAMLIFGLPILIFALIWDIKKNNIKARLFLTSVVSFFLYYGTSISFGITYNFLHLVYIALFGISLFTLIVSFSSIDYNNIKPLNKEYLSKGLYAFLIISGISLFVAWLPDIISSWQNKSLSLIEIYTTEITYVLDMGIISPLAFLCIHLLKNNKAIGIQCLQIMLTCCGIMGLVLPTQSIFQYSAGIDIPIQALITKISIFIVLSVFSFYFNIKLIKTLPDD